MSKVGEQIRAITEVVKQLQAENRKPMDRENIPVPEPASQAVIGMLVNQCIGCNEAGHCEVLQSWAECDSNSQRHKTDRGVQ